MRCGNPEIGDTISSNLRCSFFLADASRGLNNSPISHPVWNFIQNTKSTPFTFVILWFTFTLFVKSWKLSKNSLCPFQAINDGRWGVTYVVVVVFILVWLVWERMYQVVVLVKMWRLFGCVLFSFLLDRGTVRLWPATRWEKKNTFEHAFWTNCLLVKNAFSKA